MKPATTYIKYILLFYFLIRLIGITNPPLEKNHNWRQATGLMVARNFLEIDPNILYPRVDETNGGTGIIGMEFPSLNYTYYLTSKVFGHTHWYGRLINLIFSTLGLLFFFKTLRITGFKDRTALASTFILATSIWFSFSRKMMPDTYCISLMFIALYYGFSYLKETKPFHLITYTIIATIAVLSKIPAGIYFIVFLPSLLNKAICPTVKTQFAFASLIPAISTYFWYFIWNPHLSTVYGNWYNSGYSISQGLAELSSNIPSVLDNFYFDSFHSYILFTAFIIGLAVALRRRNNSILIPFILVFAVFFAYMAKSGHYFYHHNYYIIPFVPVMALVAGYGISQLKTHWIFILALAAGSIEAIANQQHDFFTKDSELYKLELEGILDEHTDRSDLIAINGNGNPQLLYLAHRRGWNCSDDQLSNPEFIENLRSQGCSYIVINQYETITLDELHVIYIDSNIKVLSLVD